MSDTLMPTCWIIAGPNGSGKTTFALGYLPTVVGCRRFINADLIAAGLSPLAPERELRSASRIFLQEIHHAQAAREDFGFEPTLSGRGYLKLISELRAAGWRIELIYLALPSVLLSQLRVAERVKHGGHDIPLADIVRRFPRSLANLRHRYAPLVDSTVCYLNDGPVPRLVFTQCLGGPAQIEDQASFDLLFTGVEP